MSDPKARRRSQAAAFGLAVVLTLALSGLLFPRQPAPRYTVTDLGVLPGYTVSEAYGVNNRGEITGTSTAETTSGPYLYNAFMYRNGKITSLGSLGNPGSSEAYAINDRGEVTGLSKAQPNGPLYAFLYSGGKMHNLGLPTANSAAGYGLNNRGEVVCSSSSGRTAFGPLGQGGGQMLSINSLGQSIGNVYGKNSCAFVYDGQKAKLTLLTVSPPFQTSYAAQINARGQIAGAAGLAASCVGIPDSPQHAVRWDNGQMVDLGVADGYTGSIGAALNMQGDVVGCCFKQPTPISRLLGSWILKVRRPDDPRQDAFLFRDRQQFDLNALVPAQTGWTLEKATGINDRGQIVGQGLHHGQERAFLLTPLR